MIYTNANGLPLYLFDRSRIECSTDCPRKRFWLYEFLGLGIVKSRDIPPYWPFITGSFIHQGIELILKGITGKEAAAQVAKAYYDEWAPKLKDKDVDIELSTRLMMELDQEVDIVIGLVYGWYLVGYPRFLSMYTTIEGGIEQEEEISWLLQIGDEQVEMRLMTRTDLLAKSKLGPTAILFNIKSTKDPNQRWRDTFSRDVQTLTEALAVEARLGIKVDGVIIEGLVKGSQKEWPPGSNFYQYYNNLIYCWVKEPELALPGEQPQGREYAAEYDYTCSEAHILGNGQRCPGGRNHRLGKRWVKRAARESFPGGVYGWLDYLMRINPRVVEGYFIQLPPILRDEYQVETWKRCKLHSEKERQDHAALVNQAFTEGDKQQAYILLDHFFDRYEGWQCKGCSYERLCWEAGDPFDMDSWAPRIPNHKLEGEMLVQIAGVKVIDDGQGNGMEVLDGQQGEA